MYEFQKMLTMETSPLLRLEKRLNYLQNTHNAALLRSVLVDDANRSNNRQLMENLTLRLHSVDSKSKKNKRVANRIKLSSPKKIRLTKTRTVFGNTSYTGGFQPQFDLIRRSNQNDYSESMNSNLLKDYAEIQTLRPSELETLIDRKCEFGFENTEARNRPIKTEPIFPPPPPDAILRNYSCEYDNSGTVANYESQQYQTNLPPSKRVSRGSPQMALSSSSSYFEKYSPPLLQRNSSIYQTDHHSLNLPIPQTTGDPYSYMDFHQKPNQGNYQLLNSGNVGFFPQNFPFDYMGCNPSLSSSYCSSLAALGKYSNCQQSPARNANIPTSALAVNGNTTNAFENYLAFNNEHNIFDNRFPFSQSFNDNSLLKNVNYNPSSDHRNFSFDLPLSNYACP